MGNFRQAVVEVARAVMRCDYCTRRAPRGDLPQPSWIGPEYRPGYGLVVILQNPGVAPINYGQRREETAQSLLRAFAQSPSVESHTALMTFMLADMAGLHGPRWAKWSHPVGKLIDQRRLAWLNVVKFRTPGSHRKDANVEPADVRHGLEKHLAQELAVLAPRAIVSIGSEARKAVTRRDLGVATIRGHVKLQGSSNLEIAELKGNLMAQGVDL